MMLLHIEQDNSILPSFFLPEMPSGFAALNAAGGLTMATFFHSGMPGCVLVARRGRW